MAKRASAPARDAAHPGDTTLPAASTPPPRGPTPGEGAGSTLVVVALVVGLIAVFAELFYFAFGDGIWHTSDAFIVPIAALALPLTAAAIALAALTGWNTQRAEGPAHTVAIVALILGIAVVATWGLWILMTMLIMATMRPSPQPCNFTCRTSGDVTCCGGCDRADGGGCCNSGGCGGGNPCCGGSGEGGCCGGGSDGSSGSCCGSGSSGSSGGGSGGCCGSSSSSGSGGSSGGGGSKGTPGVGVLATAGGLAGAFALRRGLQESAWRSRLAAWRDALAHHPDTPAYAHDCYRIAGVRLCIGCFTTFPLFAAFTPVLAFVAPPAIWAPMLAGGLALAATQGVSALGLARTRWQKVGVKTSLGVGLAVTVVALRNAPWPAAARAGAILALAGLAYASTVPRRRRMALAGHAPT